jgi:hypothetical protein
MAVVGVMEVGSVELLMGDAPRVGEGVESVVDGGVGTVFMLEYLLAFEYLGSTEVDLRRDCAWSLFECNLCLQK